MRKERREVQKREGGREKGPDRVEAKHSKDSHVTQMDQNVILNQALHETLCKPAVSCLPLSPSPPFSFFRVFCLHMYVIARYIVIYALWLSYCKSTKHFSYS